MKIALYNLTTTTRWGGVEMFVWEIAASLAERGHQVDILGGRGRRELVRYIPGVRVFRLPYIDRDTWRKLPVVSRQYTLTKLLERLSMLPFALPRILAGRYDIVHIQKPYDLPIGLFTKLTGAKLLFGCHGKDFWLSDKAFVHLAYGAVAASRYNAMQVKQRYKIAPVVIYNGVDLDRFRPEPDKAGGDDEVLAQLGISPTTSAEPAILYAGRLIRWKGVEYLIKAMPHIVPPSTQLWIAGEGTYRSELEKLAAKLGVDDCVHFLGKLEQSDLASLYRSAAMLVATSFVNETFGMALCEAMACEAAVVATNFGGFPEVVQDGVTGLLVRPQDPSDLAKKINELLADPQRAKEFGRAGRRRVISQFSWNAVTDRLEEVYRCLAS